ncbi:unnamed protein product [Rotaria socialis]|uniref:UDENN domain-containing protein n=1 Tax=Rotaria socialis TaxID=392032 RepID=A0A817WE01_9BILA|nr:unnamed protein product [Rotaria socialis]CAF4462492.1 unnamed protein product [Rotaria socialis]
MKSKRPGQDSFLSYLFDFQSNKNAKKKDSISRTSSTLHRTFDSRDASSNLDTFLNYRSAIDKQAKTSIVNIKHSHNNNDLIINGFLFDRQLFQPMRSSYISDYENTPEDLKLNVEGHSKISTCSSLDAHLFKSAFIMTLSDGYVDKELLLEYCPREDMNVNILEELSHYKRFCFPELNSTPKNSDELLNDQSTYIFTRTHSNGQIEYGYCRRLIKTHNHITSFPLVFCIVSIYPYFQLYDAILAELTTVYTFNETQCSILMQSFYSKPLPVPTQNSSGITCVLNDYRIFFYQCPRDDRLNHDYFSTLLSSLSPKHIVHLFESMLCSKSILVFSRCPSKLSKCCLAISFLIYPFIWPYPLVSLMPSSWLCDLVDSPCPFIYGCLHETVRDTQLTFDHDTIQVDLDLNKIEASTETSYLLPVDLRQTFESSLEYISKYRAMKLNANLINIAVSEACLHVFIELLYRLPDFGKHEKAPAKNNDDKFSICLNYFEHHDSGIDLQSFENVDSQSITSNHEDKRNENRFDYNFNFDEFLSAQPESYVSFLKKFIHGMIFLKFLDDYQRNDNSNKQAFSLFSQRLIERRRMIFDVSSMSSVNTFRQTFDLLAKQIKQVSKQTNPAFSKYLKNILE